MEENSIKKISPEPKATSIKQVKAQHFILETHSNKGYKAFSMDRYIILNLWLIRFNGCTEVHCHSFFDQFINWIILISSTNTDIIRLCNGLVVHLEFWAGSIYKELETAII